MTRQLTATERMRWLQLSRTEGVGPVTFRRLLQRYGNVEAALAALPVLARNGGRNRPPKIPSEEACNDEVCQLHEMGGRHVALCEAEYPSYLRQIPDAPAVLCVRGNLEHLSHDAVAIVGARNASAVGRKMARMLAAQLAEAGFLVVSGLARGIDTAAHEAALARLTAAVVAGGVDHIYPPENAALQERMAAEQAVVSEMPLGSIPKAEHFPRRNRIISGLSRAVIVVEAALRSGSLITARLAAEQGREVFAVPGSPLDPRCEGTNRLIREGATLLTRADDVLEALRAPVRSTGFQFQELEASPAPDVVAGPDVHGHITGLLSHCPVHVDDLTREARLPPDVIVAALLELEVAGRVSRSAGGVVALKLP